MATTTACIAGEEIYRQWNSGRLNGRKLGRKTTPFGDSGDIFDVEADGKRLYLLARHEQGMGKTAPRKVNDRANLYALKDLGVRNVLAWGPGGAITHDIAVGDLVVLDDVIDFTYLRDKTFFEDSPLGFLREFPVFCPTLRRSLGDVLRGMKLIHHASGTVAVREGPRFETPAEVRMLATVGAEIVTHVFVPEVFLAKELQLCYAGICYIVNYAETGSRHRPFATTDLFGALTANSDIERLSGVVSSMSQIAANVVGMVETALPICDCTEVVSAHRRQYNLPGDWRQWFSRD